MKRAWRRATDSCKNILPSPEATLYLVLGRAKYLLMAIGRSGRFVDVSGMTAKRQDEGAGGGGTDHPALRASRGVEAERSHAVLKEVKPLKCMGPRVLGPAALVMFCVCIAFAARPTAAHPSRHHPFGARLLSASEWLGGRGVDVYSNGLTGSVCKRQPCTSFLGRVEVGLRWQCVELAQRLYTARGWYEGTWGTDAWAIFKRARDLGMERHPNGSGYVPVPGDMIIIGRGPETPAGHVSIVDHVLRDRVQVVEQNWANGDSAFGSYERTGSTLERDGLPVVGVVHDPDNSAAASD